jgi:prepilin signal peptidase PulO-like enzyme (type II secretory pathway)
MVELVTALLFLVAWRHESGITDYGSWFLSDYMIHNPKFIIQVLRDWFLIAVMTVIFVYDLRWYYILDKVTIPSFIVIAGLNLYLGLDWQNMLISVIIGGSFFLLQFVVSDGKWIGGGDIRLGALMGAALGWPQILTALFIAYILGSAVGLSLIAGGKKQWGSKVPFGTFLSVATIITLFWGERLVDWYLNLFRF